jgi:hypothetical protein
MHTLLPAIILFAATTAVALAVWLYLGRTPTP